MYHVIQQNNPPTSPPAFCSLSLRECKAWVKRAICTDPNRPEFDIVKTETVYTSTNDPGLRRALEAA